METIFLSWSYHKSNEVLFLIDTKLHIQTGALKKCLGLYLDKKTKKVSKCNTSIEFMKAFSYEKHQDRWYLDYGDKSVLEVRNKRSFPWSLSVFAYVGNLYFDFWFFKCFELTQRFCCMFTLHFFSGNMGRYLHT